MSCTWSCCQDRKRCILRSRLTSGVTARSGNECSWPSLSATSSSPRPILSLTPNRLSCRAGFGTLDPPGLPASYCSPSVLQQARNCWPSEVLYWCVQSPGSRYTPVIRPTNLTRGLTDGLMIYSLSFTILSQPSPQATPSPYRAPMINCGSLPMVLSKLQELVLPCT